MIKKYFTSHAKSSTGILIIKLISAGSGFFITLTLARFLGAYEYGVYAFAFAWIRLLGVPANLGFPQLSVRVASILKSRGDWNLFKGYWKFSNSIVLTSSLLLFAICFIMSSFLISSQDVKITFWFSLTLLPLFALNQVRQATMRGIHFVIQSQYPELVIRPILFLTTIVFLFSFTNFTPSAQRTMFIQICAATISLIVGYIWFKKVLPINLKNIFPEYKRIEWTKSALPLLIVSGLFILNSKIDIVMLGSMKSKELVGIYQVVKKLVDVVGLLLVSANTAIAPSIASLYSEKNFQKLQNILTRSARAVLLGTILLSFVLIILNTKLLRIFGCEFTRGNIALIILCATQIINASFGSIGVLLIMTGYERVMAKVVGISVMINITLNFILIPQFGINGAAIATAISLVVWNLLLLNRSHKLLDLYPTALKNI